MTRNFNKVISVIYLSVLMVCSIGNVCFAEQTSDKFTYTVDSKFNDVKTNDWFYEAVSKCEDLGIVGGYGDGNFGPNDPVTLQQVCLMSLRCYLKFTTGNPEKEDWTMAGRNMHDTIGASLWTCKEFGFLPSEAFTGEKNGRLHTRQECLQPAYREEALSCFYRVIRYEKYFNITEATNNFFELSGKERIAEENPQIPDYNEIDDLYKNDIKGAYSIGIAQGYDSTGAFKPKNEITRAEFCQMMLNSGIIEMLHFKDKGLL